MKLVRYGPAGKEKPGLVDSDVIKSTCLVGTPEEIIEQIRRLEEAGLNLVMLLPSFETQYRVIEDFTRKVMEKM